MSTGMSTPVTANGVMKEEEETESFLSYILDQVQTHRLVGGGGGGELDRSRKVIEFVHPAEMGDKLGGLAIDASPSSRAALEEICANVIRYSVKTGHPAFYNQLYHGVDEYGIAGAWLSDALNTNNHTYEVAPVFIVVERAVLRFAMDKFGFDSGDGIFSPGGSISNMYGMILARHKLFPALKKEGLSGLEGPLVAFTSEESHYSIVKAANWLGIGTDNVVKVKTDERGRMLPGELDDAIARARLGGKKPFFVNATSGTTVMGAFDPLDLIADVCAKHGGVWLHADACWGGSAILSRKLRHQLSGCERADSVAWNPHKMLGAPLQSSVFITRHAGLLHEANSASASYLFQQDKFYDVAYDTGDKSIQCGRKVDAFKLWFMLKARGEAYFEDIVDNAFEQARYLQELVCTRTGFRPVFGLDSEPGCTNVCFYYIPERFRGQVEDDGWWQKLSAVPPKIKERMIKKGSLMIGYNPLPHKNKVNFFRMVLAALPKPTREDMEFVVEEIERCGKEL